MTLSMQRALLFCLLLIGSTVLGLTTIAGRNEASKSDLNTPIRVLLDKAQHDFTIKSPLSALYIKLEGAERWTRLSKEAKIKFSRKKTQIFVNGLPFNSSVIYLRGGSQHTDPIQYGTSFYRGALKVLVNPDGLLVTNIIPLDDYLRGMVAGEMSPHWELEALKAQVVAARTYAMYMMKHPKSPLYDLERGIGDQVYLGANGEADRVRLAIESTRDQILTKNSFAIKPFYHSRCGGATESANRVWNQNSHEKISSSVPCPYCQKFPYRWKTTLKAKDFLNALKIPLKELKPFKISLLNKAPSGRVKEVAIETTPQDKHLINSEELRQLLGYSQIKSTLFHISLEKDEVVFQGQGSGHGVGMCQWGAQFLAKQGKSYRDILAHYYPSLKLN